MKILSKLKRLTVLRGGVAFAKSYFTIRRSGFGSIGRTTILTPPIILINEKNIYLGEHTSISSNSFISTLNARFIIKNNCAVASGLTVETGNHARIPGMFITDISEDNKPEGFDKDVVVENDVWIGCNVTLLAGVHIGRGATIAAGAVVKKMYHPIA